MDLSENLQLLRKKQGISQEKLAEKFQLSRQAITKWESGDSFPSIENLILLADLYHVSLDELVGRKPIDKYEKFQEYLKEFKAEDVAMGEDDDISAVVHRYLVFTKRIGISDNDILEGLKEVFLK
jgi:transcriptional regulator with XRE-family HTH domain